MLHTQPTPSRTTTPVRIDIGLRAELPGDLAVPEHAKGLVIFAHGSGSSRYSTRNRYVADVLDQYDFATLLIDLLTEEEEAIDLRTGRLAFDMTLLANRLVASSAWARSVPALSRLSVGIFGARTGGGAALLAAAQEPRMFRAIVSRGGRPDLAGSAVRRVMTPVLFIVAGRDEQSIDVHQRVIERMHHETALEIVRDATALFDNPGALERVANLTARWFEKHL
jgi:putative phosphoribosyl transferase